MSWGAAVATLVTLAYVAVGARAALADWRWVRRERQSMTRHHRRVAALGRLDGIHAYPAG